MKKVMEISKDVAFLKKESVSKKNGVTVITVENQQEGLAVAKDFLYKKVNGQTLLLLSGGSTPKDLYEALAKEGKIKAKTVGLVDERADGSNFKMIKETGLLDHFNKLGVNFISVNKIYRLFISSKNKVAVMGIGEDGHTAGLPPGIKNSKFSPRGGAGKIQNYVIEIDNFPGEFKERITLTFKSLSKLDLLIVLAFGKNKKEALKKMFEKGSLEEIPARFYAKEKIAKKTILITDQKI